MVAHGSPAALRRPLRRAALLALALSLGAAGSGPAAVAAQQPDHVLYLVRHGEVDADGTRDPALSAAGRDRARTLEHVLSDAGLTHLHSTDLRRTRQTGGPTARATGLEVRSYDPSDLVGFAAWLLRTPGRHLVLGHSNTTPALVRALGGDPGGPIDELEFDRLYIVRPAAGEVETILLRYGTPYGE